MDERKRYTNTDELQADDQLSPKPSSAGDDDRKLKSGDGAASARAEDDQRLPRPATSE